MAARLLSLLAAAWLVLASPVASANPPVDTRAAAPNPAQGEPYDGIKPKPTVAQGFLWVPRVLLFPFRLLFWGLQPLTRVLVEFEQRHHIYGHLYALSTSRDGQIGIRPTFWWLNSFRPMVGLHFFQNRLLGPGTRTIVELAGGPDVVSAWIHLRPTSVGRPMQAFFDARYDRRNDYLFSGLGSAAPLPENSLSRYQQDRFDVGARLDLRPAQVIAFTFGNYFGLRRFANGEEYNGIPPIDLVYCDKVDGVCVPGTVNEALVPGFNQGTQFWRTSAGVHLDLRDDRIRPTVGALISAEADYSHGLGDDQSSYFRIRGAATLTINLWTHSHLLVLRGVTELVLPVGDATVPFSELPTLGGPLDLRGFMWQEFRGFSSLIATAEYRWPLLLWVDAAVFFDYGGVFNQQYQGFGAQQMQPDIGFGIRLHTRDRFYVKMDVAYGFDGGGWRLYLAAQNLP